MSEMVITLVKVRCDEVTDDFLEGLADEFGWRITIHGTDGETLVTEEIPMEGMEQVAAGRLRTRVAATMPLTEAADAHRRVLAGGVRGKLVLTLG